MPPPRPQRCKQQRNEPEIAVAQSARGLDGCGNHEVQQIRSIRQAPRHGSAGSGGRADVRKPPPGWSASCPGADRKGTLSRTEQPPASSGSRVRRKPTPTRRRGGSTRPRCRGRRGPGSAERGRVRIGRGSRPSASRNASTPRQPLGDAVDQDAEHPGTEAPSAAPIRCPGPSRTDSRASRTPASPLTASPTHSTTA